MSVLNYLQEREEHLKWFAKVESKSHWKNPIHKVIVATEEEMRKIDRAVIFFHGQGLSFHSIAYHQDGTYTFRVYGRGYCCY